MPDKHGYTQTLTADPPGQNDQKYNFWKFARYFLYSLCMKHYTLINYGWICILFLSSKSVHTVNQVHTAVGGFINFKLHKMNTVPNVDPCLLFTLLNLPLFRSNLRLFFFYRTQGSKQYLDTQEFPNGLKGMCQRTVCITNILHLIVERIDIKLKNFQFSFAFFRCYAGMISQQ